MSYREKKYLAKIYRKNPTKSEFIFWQKIRNKQFLNLKFKRQYIILGYIIDFYCPQYKLAIEIDGKIHEKNLKNDKKRQKIIEEKKIIFIRFNSEEIENNIGSVLEKIKKIIKTINSPSPSKMERGQGVRIGGEDGVS